ncbi:MAG: HPr family phosphocarrier protein [Tissierellaceae bacterium]|jgi:phosphocarrier protein HPr|nr:HPr family phosphocarrier protein [Tissierellia bacterium]
MYIEKVVLELETGLHARPALKLVNTASKFSSEIKLIIDGEEFNAKSIMGLLSIGATKGDVFIIKAEGEDAKEAVEGIKKVICKDSMN